MWSMIRYELFTIMIIVSAIQDTSDGFGLPVSKPSYSAPTSRRNSLNDGGGPSITFDLAKIDEDDQMVQEFLYQHSAPRGQRIQNYLDEAAGVCFYSSIFCRIFDARCLEHQL